MNKNYYVYIYYDPRYSYKVKTLINCKHLPIYVGKGKGNRYLEHLNKAKNVFLRKYIEQMRIEGVEPIIDQVAFFDNEKDAYNYEYDLIVDFGIIYDLTGSLFNKARGGELFITYNRDYRKTLLKEYRKLVTSDPHVEYNFSHVIKKIIIDKNEINKQPKKRKVEEIKGETIPEFIRQRIMEYLKIGIGIKECSHMFKIPEVFIWRNIPKSFIEKWVV